MIYSTHLLYTFVITQLYDIVYAWVEWQKWLMWCSAKRHNLCVWKCECQVTLIFVLLRKAIFHYDNNMSNNHRERDKKQPIHTHKKCSLIIAGDKYSRCGNVWIDNSYFHVLKKRENKIYWKLENFRKIMSKFNTLWSTH